MPKKEIIETGKTVDAAIESACEKLGCVREDCEWEIIDLPKKGFLGLKNIPAKVRVSVEVPETTTKAVKQEVAERQTASPATAKAAPQPRRADVQPPQAASATMIVKGAEKEQVKKSEGGSSKSAATGEKAGLARAYLEDIISKMGLAAELSVTDDDGGICVNIEGKGLGAIIGRRGETLDAIQYLTSLVANRSDGDYTRVTIDCGDYRTKRRETLETLAKKLSAQVKRTNTSRTLEPMNPFERRIIHATVSEIEGVTSISTGEEPNRRVVITTPSARGRTGRSAAQRTERNHGEADNYRGNRDFRETREARDSDEAKPSRGDYGNRPPRGRGGRDFRNGPRRQDSRTQTAPVSSNEPPKKTPEAESTDKPLYAKIDLD